MIIRKFENRDFDRIRQIALSSFSLDSFHKDPSFTRQQADRIIWEIWTMPACDANRSRCFIAEQDGIVSGFVLFGGMKELGTVLDHKIGTIIILAVEKQYRNSPYKFGSSLVKFMLSYFQKAGARIVTVGTDRDNIPALKCYHSAGFRSVLNWSTYRHSGDRKLIPAAEIHQKSPDISFVREKFERPVSFLSDNRFSEETLQKIRNWYIEGLIKGINSGEYLSVQIDQDSSRPGYVVFQEEKAVSMITGKRIWRMNDILADEPGRATCILQALNYIMKEKGAELVECFVNSQNANLISDLESCGWKKVHDAVTLHFQGNG